jgi:methylmalonyl-CoA/ethylmalonyl-CoA epimerase
MKAGGQMKNIDHIGIATKSLEKSLALWIGTFGYRQKTEPVVNTRQKVRVVFLGKEGSIDIKLIEPVGKDSPVYRFAMRGGGLHHLCFITEDLRAKLAELSDDGFRPLSGPEPGEAFANEDIAFVYMTQGLNVELIDTLKRTDLI